MKAGTGKQGDGGRLRPAVLRLTLPKPVLKPVHSPRFSSRRPVAQHRGGMEQRGQCPQTHLINIGGHTDE